jgi:acyl dehydratase
VIIVKKSSEQLETEQGEGKITEKALAEMRARIGKPMRHLQRSVTITDEWIDRYALGVADLNPLWSDPVYAKRGIHRELMAPSTMIYVLSGWDVGTGFPGVHALYTRSKVEWFKPIMNGDQLDSTGCIHELSVRPSRFAGQTALQGVKIDYINQKKEKVCTAEHWNLRTERGEARKRSGERNEAILKSYTPEEITALENEMFREVTRGDLPRLWSDVGIGEELPPVVKGPLTVTDMVGYMRSGFGGVSGGFFMYTHAVGSAFRRRHPHAVIRNEAGVPDSPEAVHWDDFLAQRSGLAGAYDMGPQRIAWLGQVVTNWMGDNGFLRELDIKLGKTIIMGDTTWCRGKVIDKQKVDGQKEVTIELVAQNQRQEVVAQGKAIIQLPD